jgi:hypothetical protein
VTDRFGHDFTGAFRRVFFDEEWQVRTCLDLDNTLMQPARLTFGESRTEITTPARPTALLSDWRRRTQKATGDTITIQWDPRGSQYVIARFDGERVTVTFLPDDGNGRGLIPWSNLMTALELSYECCYAD